ncbi:MAG: cell division protein FtsQ/DivIB, partial [Bacillota bacterium]|nr:cell division protein FtsQ/DivIB [Bacillota bacterium]
QGEIHSKNKLKHKSNKSNIHSNKAQYTIIILLSIISIYFFLQSPFFAVDKIYVAGTQRLTVNEVLSLAQVQPGENILKLKSQRIKELLMTHPWIREAEINITLPSTVTINVIERRAEAVLIIESNYYVVDDEGIVMRQIQNLAEILLPTITGLNISHQVNEGDKLVSKEANTALTTLAALPEDLKNNVSELSVSDGLNLFLTGGMEIKLGGDEKIADKLKMLSDIYNNTDEQILDQIKYIDLRFTGPPIIKYGN